MADKTENSDKEKETEPVTENNDKEKEIETVTENNDKEKTTVTCLSVSVPCDERVLTTECPPLSIVVDEMSDIQQHICDKDIEISTLPEFKIKQSIEDFKPSTHYWFAIRYNGDDPEIRYVAPYANDVRAFFEDHYYIDSIGHASVLPLDEFVMSYNSDNPGEFVYYAGTFVTDDNGKIMYWSNDSGHFEPSEDYAAPVAEALGIEDAIFITFVRDDMDQTIYYRQYTQYTGAYHANNEPITFIHGDHEEQSIFYPHDYHTWYKYHGQQTHTHAHAHRIQTHYTMIWSAILLAVVCCIIGFIVSIFVSKYKYKKPVKHMALEQDEL